MKIICENCSAKYSISDEKVKGKVFKIRCKKCKESIIIRGDSEPNASVEEPVPPPQAAGEEGEAETKVFDYSGYQGDDQEAVWHLVIDGEQQGPYAAAQIAEYITAGSLDMETFAWREGFSDWLAIKDIEELARVVQPNADVAAGPATAAAEPGLFDTPATQQGGGLFDSPTAETSSGAGLFDAEPSGDLFSSGSGATPGDVFSSASSDSGDLFSAPDSGAADDGLFGGRSEGGDLFANTQDDTEGGIFASTEAASPRVSEEQAMMTGQRNENSVLFSLSNLQALAGGGGADTDSGSSFGSFGSTMSDGGSNTVGGGYAPGEEASGLIDIRAMAGSLQMKQEPNQEVDDLLSIGGGGFAPALGAPVLAATHNEGMSMGLKIAIGGGVVALLVIIVVLLVFVARGPEPIDTSAQDAKIAELEKLLREKTSGGGPANQAEIQEIKEKLESEQQKKAELVQAADEKAAPTSTAAKSAQKSSKSSDSKKSTSSAPKKSTSKSSSSSSASSKPEASEPKSKPKKHSELDDLLGGGGTAKKKKPKSSSSSSSSGGGGAVPAKLSRSEVKGGMNKVAGSVKRCGAGETGTVTIKMSISPSGRVSSANVTGKFAGTSQGRCAARAARKARFPKTQNSLTVTYPFKF